MLTKKHLNQYILADIFGYAWAGNGVSPIYHAQKCSNRHYHAPSLEKQTAVIDSTVTVRQIWTMIP